MVSQFTPEEDIAYILQVTRQAIDTELGSGYAIRNPKLIAEIAVIVKDLDCKRNVSRQKITRRIDCGDSA